MVDAMNEHLHHLPNIKTVETHWPMTMVPRVLMTMMLKDIDTIILQDHVTTIVTM